MPLFTPFSYISAADEAPAYVTDALLMNLMIYDTNSYPGTGNNITDLTGNGLNGVINGTATFNSDGYIDFDGSTNYVQVADNSQLDLGTAYTLENNIYFDNFTERWRMFHKFDSSFDGYTWSSQENNSGTLFSYVDLNLAGNSLSPSTPGTGAWKLLALVRDGNSTIMYLNGAVFWSTTTETTSAPTANNDPLYLGYAAVAGNPEFGEGRFAHGRIYTKALSSTEITQNYNALPSAIKG